MPKDRRGMPLAILGKRKDPTKGEPSGLPKKTFNQTRVIRTLSIHIPVFFSCKSDD